MTTARALVITEPGRVALQTVRLTAPNPGDITIRTAFTSISAGTERMLLAGRMPHPMLRLPVVPGYETVGQVVAAGPDAPADLIGQWVYIGGGLCYEGVHAAWGGQSTTLIVPHHRATPLGTVEPRLGVLLALAATALHGIDLVFAEPQIGGRPSVLVLGQGPVGQIAARLARARGARVTVVDRVGSRLARSVADEVVNTAEVGLREALAGPFDAIIEATGSMAVLADAIALLADTGTILLLGYYDSLQLPYMPLFMKQARLLTAREWAPGDPARCLAMIADGALDAASLLTHTLPIDQYEEGYRIALSDPECLKLVFTWNPETTRESA